MSSEPAPGHCALLRILLQGRMEALDFKLRRKPRRASAPLPWSECRRSSVPGGRRRRETFRDNSAARVAGPGRICFQRVIEPGSIMFHVEHYAELIVRTITGISMKTPFLRRFLLCLKFGNMG